MAKAWKYEELLHDVLKRNGSFHRFIGAPNFPENYLFNPDQNYGDSQSVEVVYGNDGRVSRVVGVNAKGDKASVEFEWDSVNQISTGKMKNGSITEVTIEEWLENSNSVPVLHVKTTYHSNSAYNTEIRIAKPSNPASRVYSVEIDINNKTIKGDYDAAKDTIPGVMIGLVDELNSMKSTATVAAMEGRIFRELVLQAWERGSFGLYAWQHTADGIGTILSDTFGLWTSAGYFLISNTLADESAAVS